MQHTPRISRSPRRRGDPSRSAQRRGGGPAAYRFARDRRGFTGAEKALLICFGLAIVLLVGGLIRAGSERAATDARTVLSTQTGGVKLGQVAGPVQAAGPIAAPSPIGAGNPGGLARFSSDFGQPGGPGRPSAPANPAPDGWTKPTPWKVAPVAPVAPGAANPANVQITSGLGAGVDQLIGKSPTLSANITSLQKDGWTIQYGTAGAGSATDRARKTITIDPTSKADPLAIAQTLSHESGHARYTPDAYVPPTGLTRDQYVQANVRSALKDEGEATITNLQVRKELLAAGQGDIGVAGAQADGYQKLFDKWDGTKRDALRDAIGKIYATGEHPSTDPSQTYFQYYAKTYEDFYDQTVGKKP